MAHVSLKVETRNQLGNSVRKLRREGFLPAVLYSKVVSPVSIQIKQGEFNRIFKVSGKTNVLDLKIDEGKTTIPCIVHMLDIHPVTGNIRHVDFLAVNLKEKVVATVPLVFIGESRAVKEDGGILNTVIEQIEVEALPDEIPSEIQVDLSILDGFEDVIRVENLPKSDKYTIPEDSQAVIASITTQTAEVVEEVPVTEATVETPSAESKTN